MYVKESIFTLLCSLILPCAAGEAADRDLNYASHERQMWGTGRLENYDVAVRLDDPDLAGKRITAIRVPTLATEGMSEYRIWLSSELKLDDKANSPDILSDKASVDGNAISITLAEPYVIPESGVYVGFSFDIDELTDATRQPLCVSESDNPDAFFIHTSRKYLRWGNQNLKLAADMEICLEGDFHDYAVSVNSLPDAGCVKGETAMATVIIRNHGSFPVESLECLYSLQGKEHSHTVEFNPPLAPDFFADAELRLPLEDTPVEAGRYPLTLDITMVNGIDNADPRNYAAGDIYIYPYLPERIPLMEEYTGTWCGWCPRGVIGMDLMQAAYPEKFIYVVFHKGDDIMNTGCELPSPQTTAPGGYLDRVMEVDPYNGTSADNVATYSEGIGKAWLERSKVPSLGEIEVEAHMDNAGNDRIEISARARFVREYDDTPFRIAYILTADELSGKSAEWIQSNYFSGLEKYRGTDLAPLVDMPKRITDMKFRDVVVYGDAAIGVEGSIPSTVGMLEEISHGYSIALDEAVNASGEPLVDDRTKLSVVAAIVDTRTGEVMNCAKAAVEDGSGISSVSPAAGAMSVRHGILTVSASGEFEVTGVTPDGIRLFTLTGRDRTETSLSGLHGPVILTLATADGAFTRKLIL